MSGLLAWMDASAFPSSRKRVKNAGSLLRSTAVNNVTSSTGPVGFDVDMSNSDRLDNVSGRHSGSFGLQNPSAVPAHGGPSSTWWMRTEHWLSEGRESSSAWESDREPGDSALTCDSSSAALLTRDDRIGTPARVAAEGRGASPSPWRGRSRRAAILAIRPVGPIRARIIRSASPTTSMTPQSSCRATVDAGTK
jgi:hypothetical protein